MRWLTLLLTLFIVLGFYGCGDSDDADDNGTAHIEALPDTDMLSLSMESGIESRDEAQTSPMREHTEKLMTDLNKLMADTHVTLDNLKTLGQHTTFTKDDQTCHRWTLKGLLNTWKLDICMTSGEKYGFTLMGRPVASVSDGDYKEIVAGFASKLPDYEGKKRGAGFIHYNFDNFGTLTKTQIFGTMGIGYRVAGKVRQLNIGMKDLKAGLMLQSYSALYRYVHKIGKGGLFKYLGEFDLLTTVGGLPALGMDGKKEVARRVVAWSTQGHARTLTAICGGTIDDIVGYPHPCVVSAHCWKADGTVTFDQIVEGTVNWELCDPLEITDELAAPEESELAAPDQVNDPGQVLTVPEADGDES